MTAKSKVTMDARGAYHKGYIEYSKEGGFKFVVRKNPQSRKVDWFENLPDFPQHWATLVGDDVLLPDHGTISIISFLKPNSSNNAPSANFVSAKNLLNPCPPSLVNRGCTAKMAQIFLSPIPLKFGDHVRIAFIKKQKKF
jgi:hypothetical protein